MPKNPKLQRISPQGQLLNTIQQHSVTGWDIGQPEKEKFLKINDPRKINATSGKDINPNVDKVGGTYSKSIIDDIINSSIKKEIDPYTALAVAFQETKLGKTDHNIGHTIKNGGFNLNKNNSDTDNFVDTLKNKLEYGKKLGFKNEEHQIQAYNGLGSVYPETESKNHGFKMQKIYGVDMPKEGINLKNNPLYGKRIIDLRDNVLKQNPNIIKTVDSLKTVNQIQNQKKIFDKTTADVEAPRMPNDINDFMGHKDMLDHQDNNLVQSFLT
jgi:hypothetical protein